MALYEPTIRNLATRLGQLADQILTFEDELADGSVAGTAKTYIRGRIKTKLQAIDDALDALIASIT